MSIIYENKGSSIFTSKQNGLSCNIHFHSHIELVYMLKGKTRAISDYKEVLLEKGDLFIAFPNQIHSFSDVDPVCCYLFIFPQDLCPDYSPLLNSYVPVTPFIPKSLCPQNIVSLLDAIMDSNCSDSSYNSAITKGYFYVLLGTILELMELKKMESHDLDTVRRILSYCSENYRNDISLDILSADLHINKFHISHLFGQKLKIQFSDFINSLRIDDACKRLNDRDCTITEVAFQVGFNSIRTFNRAFLKHTDVSPREYRERNRNHTKGIY